MPAKKRKKRREDNKEEGAKLTLNSTTNTNLKGISPNKIPPDISSTIRQSPGMTGSLIIRLDGNCCSAGGKTSIKEQYSKTPFIAQRALYLEESLPRMAYVYIVSVSGGILQGDRYTIDITLENKAIAHLTTQGAMRIYRMEKNNYATQILNIDVQQGCYLEYVPDQIIPYRGSHFSQSANIKVHDEATLIYSEILTSGRMASGENFGYDKCCLKTVAKNHEGKLRFVDSAVLEPKSGGMSKLGILGEWKVVASIYVLAGRIHTLTLKNQINIGLQNFDSVNAGATILPDNSGIIVRILGNNAGEIRTVVHEIIRTVRKKILNAPFSGMRKS